jgi:hypothetical protein
MAGSNLGRDAFGQLLRLRATNRATSLTQYNNRCVRRNHSFATLGREEIESR